MSLKDLSLGRYVHGSSFIHRLDPRAKLASMLIVTLVLFSVDGWRPAVFAGAFTAFVSLISGLRPGYIVRTILPFKWLILMTVALNVLFVGGHIIVEAPLPYGGITREGLDMGLLYGARIGILVLLASLLTLTTEPIVLVDGIEKLLNPFARLGIKPHEISLAMVITIRFIPILIDEAEKIRKSYKARGLQHGKGLFKDLMSVSLLFLPLFQSSLRRAETLASGMECRLYNTTEHRTRYTECIMQPRDWMALTVSGIVAVSAVWP